MRFTSAVIIGALSSVAIAQSLNGLPTCAQNCFGSSFGSCSPIDVKCICGNTSLISTLSCCVAKTCSPSDIEATIKFASNLCQANGVTVPTSASCPATSSPPASTSTNASASVTPTGSTTPTGSASSNHSGSASAGTASATSPSGSRPSGASNATGVTGVSATPTRATGAAAAPTAAIGLALAGLLGVFAAL